MIRRALDLSGSDCEDNVQIACSQMYHVDPIVTRNPDDFRQGVTVPVTDPKDIRAHLPPLPST